MNLMTWLTGKTLAELVKKGQLIPPEIKLPVYPASHYKKNWYEQGIPHGGVIGLTAIMMTMTWIVSINMLLRSLSCTIKSIWSWSSSWPWAISLFLPRQISSCLKEE